MGCFGMITRKKLLLVTKREDIRQMYAAELKWIFGNYLHIDSCASIQEREDAHIAGADLVLITNPYSFPWARRQTRPGTSIINLVFAFERTRVEALKRYPVGTETIVCFNYYSSAHQTVNVLYEAGVTNLNLYIDYPGNRNLECRKMTLALISGQTDRLPPDVDEVFDLGPRHLSLTTLLEIAVKADILDDSLEARIAQYGADISRPDDYLTYFFYNSAAAALQLRSVMDSLDDGLAICDQEFRVLNLNKNFSSLLALPGELMERRLTELPLEEEVAAAIFSTRPCHNRLCTLKNPRRSVMVSLEVIRRPGSSHSLFLLRVKDITELISLETSLHRQIAKRGHVAKHTFSDIKGESPAAAACIQKARRIAGIDKPTLIIGESGTGKELYAQSIHNASDRARFPFVAMNCAAIPVTLLESELFGYDEGAFTGARRGGKEGLFQMAHRGTLFLDEIGELPMPIQAKLLRVLEEKEIMRIGSKELTRVDVRIIAATNRDLNVLVEEKAFRLDLYYRLNTLTINIPPLRERQTDIPLLVQEFLRHEQKECVHIDPSIRDFLTRYTWRGNIRELRNCVEYMVHMADGFIGEQHLPDYIRSEYRRASAGRELAEKQLNMFSASDRQATVDVLTLLRDRPMGRRTLLRVLLESGGYMTEYRLRAILDCLHQMECIHFGKGRSGCTITATGEKLLESLKKL